MAKKADRLVYPPEIHCYTADARSLPLPDKSVDLIVTSPPYWRKRDYGHKRQIGQERTPERYATAIEEAFIEWRRVLRQSGSIFLNIGDTYNARGLVGIPALVENAARNAGLIVRNRIIWAKPNGMPTSARDRLGNRHEYVLHLTKRNATYYYDLLGYVQQEGRVARFGDVWVVPLRPSRSEHLAPFPPALVKRAISLACPYLVCPRCGVPVQRVAHRTNKLNLERAQARRAIERFRAARLTSAHIRAIQAVGISDAGKARQIQTGANRNRPAILKLAAEAKRALGGYFREFTFPLWSTAGFVACSCDSPLVPGTVLDPFAGTGTTIRTAMAVGRSAVGVDLHPIPLGLTKSRAGLARGQKASKSGTRKRKGKVKTRR